MVCESERSGPHAERCLRLLRRHLRLLRRRRRRRERGRRRRRARRPAAAGGAAPRRGGGTRPRAVHRRRDLGAVEAWPAARRPSPRSRRRRAARAGVVVAAGRLAACRSACCPAPTAGRAALLRLREALEALEEADLGGPRSMPPASRGTAGRPGRTGRPRGRRGAAGRPARRRWRLGVVVAPQRPVWGWRCSEIARALNCAQIARSVPFAPAASCPCATGPQTSDAPAVVPVADPETAAVESGRLAEMAGSKHHPLSAQPRGGYVCARLRNSSRGRAMPRPQSAGPSRSASANLPRPQRPPRPRGPPHHRASPAGPQPAPDLRVAALHPLRHPSTGAAAVPHAAGRRAALAACCSSTRTRSPRRRWKVGPVVRVGLVNVPAGARCGRRRGSCGGTWTGPAEWIKEANSSASTTRRFSRAPRPLRSRCSARSTRWRAQSAAPSRRRPRCRRRARGAATRRGARVRRAGGKPTDAPPSVASAMSPRRQTSRRPSARRHRRGGRRRRRRHGRWRRAWRRRVCAPDGGRRAPVFVEVCSANREAMRSVKGSRERYDGAYEALEHRVRQTLVRTPRVSPSSATRRRRRCRDERRTAV